MASEEKDPKKEEENSTENQDEEDASMSSWFSGWYDTAKKKLAETNEFMKHDLQEFSHSVQHDASRLVAATATTMKEKLNINVDLEEASSATRAVKDSLSNFLGNIASKVGPIRPDDDENDDEAAIVGTSSGSKVLSPSEARLYAIRTDPATFCNDPDNEQEFYAWLPCFNVEDKKEEISTLMIDISQIRSLYTKLVPSAISHADFWARYFFKVHQHDKAEERRAMLVERAHKTDDEIQWDDEDDDWVQPKNISADITTEGKIVVQSSAESETTTPKTQLQIKENRLFDEPKPTTTTKTRKSENLEKLVTEYNTEIPASKVVVVSEAAVLPKAAETVAPPAEKPVQTANIEQSKDKPDVPACAENLTTEAAKSRKPESQKPKENQPAFESSKNDVTKDPNTKTPSSGESSDSWEKDFDLDMTEDEIMQALKESDVDVDDIGENWDNWE